jgi:hypothetical protein
MPTKGLNVPEVPSGTPVQVRCAGEKRWESKTSGSPFRGVDGWYVSVHGFPGAFVLTGRLSGELVCVAEPDVSRKERQNPARHRGQVTAVRLAFAVGILAFVVLMERFHAASRVLPVAALLALAGAAFVVNRRSKLRRRGRLDVGDSTGEALSSVNEDALVLAAFDELVASHADQLPSAVLTQLARVRALAAEILATACTESGFELDLATSNALYDAREAIRTYVPDTITSFLAVPPSARSSIEVHGGSDAQQLLTSQLALIERQLERLRRECAVRRARGLAQNELFLRARFPESSLSFAIPTDAAELVNSPPTLPAQAEVAPTPAATRAAVKLAGCARIELLRSPRWCRHNRGKFLRRMVPSALGLGFGSLLSLSVCILLLLTVARGRPVEGAWALLILVVGGMAFVVSRFEDAVIEAQEQAPVDLPPLDWRSASEKVEYEKYVRIRRVRSPVSDREQHVPEHLCPGCSRPGRELQDRVRYRCGEWEFERRGRVIWRRDLGGAGAAIPAPSRDRGLP